MRRFAKFVVRDRRIYVCTANDTYQGRPLSIKEKYLLEIRGLPGQKAGCNRVTKDLPYQVEMAIGMRIMVTENVEKTSTPPTVLVERLWE